MHFYSNRQSDSGTRIFLVSSVLYAKFFYSWDTDARGESHRTLLRLTLIGTNYSVYVSRDRTNLIVQTRVCINLYLFDARVGVLCGLN